MNQRKAKYLRRVVNTLHGDITSPKARRQLREFKRQYKETGELPELEHPEPTQDPNVTNRERHIKRQLVRKGL